MVPDAQEVIETLVNLYKSGILNSTYVRQSEKEIEDEIVTLVSDAIDNIFLKSKTLKKLSNFGLTFS